MLVVYIWFGLIIGNILIFKYIYVGNFIVLMFNIFKLFFYWCCYFYRFLLNKVNCGSVDI